MDISESYELGSSRKSEEDNANVRLYYRKFWWVLFADKTLLTEKKLCFSDYLGRVSTYCVVFYPKMFSYFICLW